MEGVSFGEFVGWFFSSWAFVYVALAILVVHCVRITIGNDRRVTAKMRQMGLIDEHGRRIPRDPS